MKKLFLAILLSFTLVSPVLAGKSIPTTISITDGVHGGYVEATVNNLGTLPKNSTEAHVFAQCYVNSTYVYAAYFSLGETIGPLASTLWTEGSANCLGTVGYFTRNGFGRWVALASDEFIVN